MNHTTGTIQTTDGLRLYTEAWLPDGDSKAIVLIVHGICEHIGRYAHVARCLVEHGYAVYGIDHRTHGKSEGEPRVYINDFHQVVADLKGYFDQSRADNPNLPIFVYGHSMGALIATLFTVRYQDELAGFISSGSPLTFDQTVSGVTTMIGKFLNRVAPTLPLVKLELDAISRDPAVVAAYKSDPLVWRTPIRVGMAINGNMAIGPLRERLPELRLPLLILHGGEDKVVPVSGCHLLYEKASSDDKTMKIYPGLYHEIHNEPEQAIVLTDITDWLDAHSQPV